MAFKMMGLSDPLLQGILAIGYTAPTEIQSKAIPAIIEGKDIIGCAQTGTGKTAAFVLPILNRFEVAPKKSKTKRTRALVLTPTRELAIQIEQAIRGYGKFMKLRTIAIYGGSSISDQIRFLKSGVDVIVATPGRLIDHLQRGTVELSDVEMLVLDEADHMLDMGFIDNIKKIVKEIPTNRQTLLFSATMPDSVKKLTQSIQNSPVMIQIGRQHNPVESVTQHIFPVEQGQKMDLLIHLLAAEAMTSVLVFSRTKHGADKICKKLTQYDIQAVAIHSDRTQRQRLRALDGFKSGKYQVMVATDIAARGINVEGISHVINFDVPAYAEDYIHRIGRTGRASATGDAMTFVAQDEVLNLRKIEKFIERKFEPAMVDGFAYTGKVDLAVAGKGKSQKSSSKRSGSGSGSFKRRDNNRPKGDSQSSRDGKPAKSQSGFAGNKKASSKKWSKKPYKSGGQKPANKRQD